MVQEPTSVDKASTWLIAKFGQEVKDANDLLTFAVSRGLTVEDETIRAMKDGEQLLISRSLPEPAKRAEFEKAYRALAQKLSPVTIETLRATDDKYGRRIWPLTSKPLSEGRLWSRKLWVISALFILFLVIGESMEIIMNHPSFAVDDKSALNLLGMSLASWQLLSVILAQLVPFAYGGLGACASLLGSVHRFVYERTFDPNRRPQYIGRILLGMLSGGAILLFIDPEETAAQIGAAALAFLAGYNTDFLFATIERVTEALFPKVSAQGAARPTTEKPPAPMSPEKVAKQNSAATDEEKKTLHRLQIPIKKPSPVVHSAPRPQPPSAGIRMLGRLSEKYETGGRGPGTVSGGIGDPGGASYGSYQMTSKPNGGTVARYISQPQFPWRGEFDNLEPGSDAFTEKWKEIADNDADKFQDSQHDYIKRTHFDPFVAKIKRDDSLDVTTRYYALQDVIWSTAVQHGANNSVVHRALSALKSNGAVDVADPEFDSKLIRAIYAERGRKDADGNLVYFRRSSSAVQQGVAKRFVNEEMDALKMLENEA